MQINGLWLHWFILIQAPAVEYEWLSAWLNAKVTVTFLFKFLDWIYRLIIAYVAYKLMVWCVTVTTSSRWIMRIYSNSMLCVECFSNERTWTIYCLIKWIPKYRLAVQHIRFMWPAFTVCLCTETRNCLYVPCSFTICLSSMPRAVELSSMETIYGPFSADVKLRFLLVSSVRRNLQMNPQSHMSLLVASIQR